MFKQKFDKFAGIGDTISCDVDGFQIVARIEHDPDMGPPWEEHDGHGVVSEWTSRPKKPSERVLVKDRSACRYYDIAESTRIARRDGWDAEPYGGTPGEKAARAVEADFKRMQAWCRDEWTWAYVALSVSREGVELDRHAASLGGIESDAGEYFDEVAEELLEEAIDRGRKVLAKLCPNAA